MFQFDYTKYDVVLVLHLLILELVDVVQHQLDILLQERMVC